MSSFVTRGVKGDEQQVVMGVNTPFLEMRNNDGALAMLFIVDAESGAVSLYTSTDPEMQRYAKLYGLSTVAIQPLKFD